MARSQKKSQKKVSGGRYHATKTKRKYELARFTSQTKIGSENKAKTIRVRGGNAKERLLLAAEINVADGKGKTQKTKLLNVVDNPANQNLVRRNILTKGAIVETALGKVKITSRPGQGSSVNGMLVENK